MTDKFFTWFLVTDHLKRVKSVSLESKEKIKNPVSNQNRSAALLATARILPYTFDGGFPVEGEKSLSICRNTHISRSYMENGLQNSKKNRDIFHWIDLKSTEDLKMKPYPNILKKKPILNPNSYNYPVFKSISKRSYSVTPGHQGRIPSIF